MKHLRGWANPPTVLAALALFVALGGSSFAAPARDAAKKLISGKSIKNNSIASTDIKNNSVGSKDIKNGSLLKKDFKAGQLPKGLTGARGATGPAGGTGRLSYVTSGFLTVTKDSSRLVSADCPPGQYATGGSIDLPDPSSSRVAFEAPRLDSPGRGSWGGTVFNDDTNNSTTVDVFAVCAPGPEPDDSAF